MTGIPSDTTAADTFDRAADMIEERGWWSGRNDSTVNTGKNTGKKCAGLALLDSILYKHNHSLNELCRMFCQHLGIENPPQGHIATAIYDWNDQPHRTQEQVVKELRACAANLRKGT